MSDEGQPDSSRGHSDTLVAALHDFVDGPGESADGAPDVNQWLDEAGVQHPHLQHATSAGEAMASPDAVVCPEGSHPVVTTWTDRHGQTHMFWSCS